MDVAVLDYDTKTRYGFDVEYHIKNFILFGEYINGADAGSTTEGGGCGGGAPVVVPGDQDSKGYYGMIVYRWNNFEPVYKFEGYERTKTENDVVVGEPELDMWHTAGLNFYPNDWVRLQLNYIYKTEDPKEIKNDCLILQVQVKF